jgi:hypothetical protein
MPPNLTLRRTQKLPQAHPLQSKNASQAAGDKSVASFRDTFGRDLDSDDGRVADKLAAEEAAKPPEDLTGTQFISRQDTLEENADAMEDDQHSIIHLGTYNSLPPLPESSSESATTTSSSSSASSSTSGTSHDTEELAQKLLSNQYNVLRKHTIPKIPTQIDETSGSKSDSTSHQSSGQESGASTDHFQEGSSGRASVRKDAGNGD